ncbi:MAG: biopolymer transporter ExbD [Nannocystaceae bacterium]|nr:biopolymer transporter ExbD [Nannocystaceae bacterium]
MTPEEEQAFLERKKAKRAGKRGFAEEGAVLGMTSLMDAITIIVTYLLKNYGSDPVVIAPTAGQKVPNSTADTPIQDGVPIYVTQRAITFMDRRVVQMDENGEVDPAALQGHLIGPLYDLLAEEADRAKKMAEGKGEEWEGRIILVGDQNLKFSVLVDVMYTAGRAEFREYAFCVVMKNQ